MADDVHGLVLYDGVCGLCDRSVQFLIEADRNGRLHYAPLQGVTAEAVRSRHPEADDDLSTIVYVRGFGTENERLFERSDAALEILRDLGGVYRLSALLRVTPKRIRDAVYDWIARNRYRWFGRLDACRIPTPEQAKRFLS